MLNSIINRLLLTVMCCWLVHSSSPPSNCIAVNVTLPPSGVAINASCPNVTYIDVTVYPLTAINVSIDAIVRSNPDSSPITIKFLRLTLQHGALLNISGSPSPSAVVGVGPVVTILVEDLRAVDGALVVCGAFPPGTSILISGAIMTMSNNYANLQLQHQDPAFDIFTKQILIVSLSLVDNSVLVISSSSLAVTAAIDCLPIYMSGKMSLLNGSFFSILGSTVRSMLAAGTRGFVLSGTIVIRDSSSMAFGSTAIEVNLDGYAVLITDSLVDLDRQSTLSFTNCSFATSVTAGFSLRDSVMTLNASSQLIFVSCALSAASSGVGLTIVQSSMTLVRNSSWIFQSCNLTGTLAGMNLIGSTVSVLSSSMWGLLESNFSGSTYAALGIISSSIFVSGGGSIVSLFRCKLTTSAGFAALLISNDLTNLTAPGSRLVASNSSAVSLSHCILEGYCMTANCGGLIIYGSSVLITNGSTFRLLSSSITSLGLDGGLVLERAVVVIMHSSEWILVGNTIISIFRAALSIAVGSSVVVSDLSLWMVSNGSMVGQRGAMMTTADSVVRLMGSSAWHMNGVMMEVTGGATSTTKAVVLLSSGVTVMTSSEFVVSGNTLQVSPSSAASIACLNLGQLSLSTFGNIRLTENNCTASSVFLAGSWNGAGDGSTVIERCNTMNGARWLPSLLEMSGVVSLLCGRCDARVDCFWPLVEPTAYPKMRCDDQCRCSTGCGAGTGGNLCLPGPGTYLGVSDGTCVPNAKGSGRFGLTRTVSLNESFTAGTMTRTLTLEEEEQVEVLRWSSAAGPLHASFVAAVSAAVVLYGPSGAGTMQRMAAQQTVNSCSSGKSSGADFSSSPTQMNFGPAGGTASSNAPYVRGTVIGNVLLWAACVAVAGIASLVLMRRGVTSKLRESGILLGLPGRLYAPFSMLVVPTLTAGTMLLAGGGVVPGDAAVGILGIVVCGTSIAAIVLTTTGQRFMAAAVPSGEARATDLATKERVVGFVATALANPFGWVNRRRRAAVGFVERHGLLFEAYRPDRQWFCGAELSASAAGGVIAGLVLLDDGDGTVCERLQVVSAMAAVSFLLGVALLRPYGAAADGHLALTNAAVTATSAVLGACGVDTTVLTAAQAYLNAASAILIVAALIAEGRLTSALRHARDLLGGARDRTAHSSASVVGGKLFGGLQQQQQQHRALGGSATDRLRALESIINLICSPSREEDERLLPLL